MNGEYSKYYEAYETVVNSSNPINWLLYSLPLLPYQKQFSNCLQTFDSVIIISTFNLKIYFSLIDDRNDYEPESR